jgi:hypothetical protein
MAFKKIKRKFLESLDIIFIMFIILIVEKIDAEDSKWVFP